jgi:hypothetical protein
MAVIILYMLYIPQTSATELTFIVVSEEELCMLIAWDKALYSTLAQSHMSG